MSDPRHRVTTPLELSRLCQKAGVFALVLTCAGCSQESNSKPSGSTPRPAAQNQTLAPLLDVSTEDLDRVVADLVRAFKPVEGAASSLEQTAWIERRREWIEGMRGADPELGLALLGHLEQHPDEPLPQREALLTSACYCAPEAALELLVEAIDNYGGGKLRLDLGLRGRAAELLAEIAPERAFEVLEPLLKSGPVAETKPPSEPVLMAYLRAGKALGHDVEPTLCLVATDIRQADITRHKAIEALGEAKTELGRKALLEVLTESTGNAYLRRKAAQAVARAFGKEQAMRELEQVMQYEADERMQVFLGSLLDKLAAEG